MIFLALYSGSSIKDSKLIAVSVDGDLIQEVSGRLLNEPEIESDPILSELDKGRRAALLQVCNGATEQKAAKAP